ncbi:MAG: 50S ribosomal protein L10 [Candidatus Eremiobacteraeota bacterium]|nr:50S ribosomal protein L10 [Candidatus Eremiobacteraeota bacterium]MBC5820737.1 50S ribosomal protein L10 [Candidatus Eremiobacteraeota bacterium]
MPTAKKGQTIDELRKRLAETKYLFFTNYAGLTVGEITRLRTELRKDGSSYAVVKNTLFSLAAGDELAKKFDAFLAGPTGVVFAPADPVAPAKALKQFSDGVKTLEVKAGYVDGRIIDAAQVQALAALPPKAELQAKVLGVFASPLRGLVGVLAANPGGFVRVLSAREKQLVEPAAVAEPAPA